MSASEDLYTDQGCTFSSTIPVYGSTKEPFDLTGYSARGQIRKSYTSTNFVDFTCVIQNGSVVISLTATQTRAMKAGRYLYDVEIYNASNNVIRIAQGIFEVSPSVTHNQTVSSTTTPPTDLSVIWYDPTDDSYAYYDTNSQAWIKYN